MLRIRDKIIFMSNDGIFEIPEPIDIMLDSNWDILLSEPITKSTVNNSLIAQQHNNNLFRDSLAMIMINGREEYKPKKQCFCDELKFPEHNHIVHYGGCKNEAIVEVLSPYPDIPLYICVECAIDTEEKVPEVYSFYNKAGVRCDLNHLKLWLQLLKGVEAGRK